MDKFMENLNMDYVFLGCKITIFTLLFLGFILLIRYLMNNHIFKLIFAKIKGNIAEADRIRASNIRKSISLNVNKKQSDAGDELEQLKKLLAPKEEKHNKIGDFLEKIHLRTYSLLYYSGLIDKGFSITTLFILLVLVTITASLFIGLFISPMLGIASAILIPVAFWYTLHIQALIKREHLENQLTTFVNSCASASMKYVSLIDILGEVYPDMEEPLKSALKYCYNEAKQKYDTDTALMHLKNKFNSEQFNFVIDTLALCSRMMGDYRVTSNDIADTTKIYYDNYIKKQTAYKIGRSHVILIGLSAFGLTFILGSFISGLWDTALHTTLGNILSILFVILFVCGITMRSKR